MVLVALEEALLVGLLVEVKALELRLEVEGLKLMQRQLVLQVVQVLLLLLQHEVLVLGCQGVAGQACGGTKALPALTKSAFKNLITR